MKYNLYLYINVKFIYIKFMCVYMIIYTPLVFMMMFCGLRSLKQVKKYIKDLWNSKILEGFPPPIPVLSCGSTSHCHFFKYFSRQGIIKIKMYTLCSILRSIFYGLKYSSVFQVNIIIIQHACTARLKDLSAIAQ